MNFEKHGVLLHEMWEWPEFRAFAERLGIPLDVPTQYLSVIGAVDTPVKFHQVVTGKDEKRGERQESR